ncbi:MAG: hypothetical protein U5O39_09950 [Gammaproteobacteria bacterium]|nr:hypothetical protein [Gammaproteobacteria bacterium]
MGATAEEEIDIIGIRQTQTALVRREEEDHEPHDFIDFWELELYVPTDDEHEVEVGRASVTLIHACDAEHARLRQIISV